MTHRAALSLASLALAALAGCRGIPVSVENQIATATETEDIGEPLQLEPLAMAEPVPVALQGSVPIAIQGPISLQLQVQGPSVKTSGTYISEGLMDRVGLNETLGEWVLAVFGEPDFRTRLSDGTEIWKWVYEAAGSQGSLVSLLGGDKEEKPSPRPIITFVRIRDGVVVEKWRG